MILLFDYPFFEEEVPLGATMVPQYTELYCVMVLSGTAIVCNVSIGCQYKPPLFGRLVTICEFEIQVLTVDCEPPVWGRGGRMEMEMGPLSSPMVTTTGVVVPERRSGKYF